MVGTSLHAKKTPEYIVAGSGQGRVGVDIVTVTVSNETVLSGYCEYL